jgi:hypothetical protein
MITYVLLGSFPLSLSWSCAARPLLLVDTVTPYILFFRILRQVAILGKYTPKIIKFLSQFLSISNPF